MTDFIRVPGDSIGKKVHTRQITLPDAEVVQRQQFEAGTTNPQVSWATQATVAAGGQASLDSPQITNAKVGKLVMLIVASTVPLKAALHTVVDATPSASPRAVFIMGSERTREFTPPGRDFFKVTGNASAGLDGWRVVATNLDPSEAADIYVTWLYDEEDT
jgi:hypothetical protein